MPQAFLFSFFGSLVLGALLIPYLRARAHKMGTVDLPDDRKIHRGAVPLVGGIACLIVLAMQAVGFNLLFEDRHLEFYAGAFAFTLIGFFDDRNELSAKTRLLAQAVVCVALLGSADMFLRNLGDLFGTGDLSLGFAAVPFTVIGLIGVVNAMNMTDGVDGLAGSVALTALISFLSVLFLISAPTGDVYPFLYEQGLIALSLCGALVAFLGFNLRAPWLRQATVFLGDAGSNLLGFVLAWYAIGTTNNTIPGGLAPVCALWILIVPLFDSLSCIVRRLLSMRNPMRPDRQHLHHLLLVKGFTPTQVTLILSCTNAAGGAIAVIAWIFRVPESIMFSAYAILFVAFSVYVLWAWKQVANGQILETRAELRAVLPESGGD